MDTVDQDAPLERPEAINNADVCDDQPALHSAVASKKIAEVTRILNNLNDGNRLKSLIQKNPNSGEIPLHVACKGDHTKIVEQLLDSGYHAEQLEAQNDAFGNTPLHVVANASILEAILRCLKTKMGDQSAKKYFRQLLEKKNKLKDTPVHCAAVSPLPNHLLVLEEMYKECKECITFKGRFDGLPFHSACGYGRIEVVKQLFNWSQQEAELCDNPELFLDAPSKLVDLPSFTRSTETSTFEDIKKGDFEKVKKEDFEKVKKEDFEKVKKEIKDLSDKEKRQQNKNKTTNRHNTPLTRACQFGHSDVVKFLLEKSAKTHPLALIKAIEGKFENCVQLLLFLKHKSPKGESSKMELLNHKYIPVDSPVLTTPFHELIKHMPETAEAILNTQKCGTHYSRFLVCSQNFKIRFKYNLVDNHALKFDETKTDIEQIYHYTRSSMQGDTEIDSVGCVPCCKSCCKSCHKDEVHPLLLMVEYKRDKLLTHPLVASLIHDKWRKYGPFSVIHWLIYVAFMIIVNYLMLSLPNPNSVYCIPGNGTDNESCSGMNETDNFNCTDPSISKSSMIGLAITILIYSVIRLGFKSIQALASMYKSISCAYTFFDSILKSVKRMKYFWDLTNWVELVLFILSSIFAVWLVLPTSEELCMAHGNWQIGATVTWLTWIELMFISTQFQLIGVYAIMFKKVFKSLFELIPLASTLIIGFGLVFYFLLHQPQYQASPYFSQGYSFLNILSMTTGESDTSSFFGLDFNGKNHDTEHLKYLGLSTFFWIIALMLLTVGLSNLLIALAVGDIQPIYDQAKFEKLALEADFLLMMENNLLVEGILSCCIRNRCKKTDESMIKEVEPNKYSSEWKPWLSRIYDEFIYLLWGGVRCDSHESIERLTKYEWPLLKKKDTLLEKMDTLLKKMDTLLKKKYT